MAKRTVELEDSTGPFGVKLKGDTEGIINILIYDKGTESRVGRLSVPLDGPGRVEDLGLMLQHMAESLAIELNR